MSHGRCFFMPQLRTGDLLFNAVVLQQRLVDRTTTHEALEAVRGSVGGNARDMFGHNVSGVSTHLFADPNHADQILKQHTFFGVFQHALSEQMVRIWGCDLKAGRYQSSLRSLGASATDFGALTATSLRSCRQCIACDVEHQGFATWKLVHQMSAIDRCPDHGSPLDLESRPIGGSHARIWPLRLPGEDRVSRAGRVYLAPSDGYAAYLRLWQRVLTDELPWLKPSAWIQSMQAAVLRLGGIDAATRAIESDVLRAWGAPIGDISVALSLDGRVNPIKEELLLRSRPKDIARRMLMHGSLDRLGLDLFGCGDGDQRALVLLGSTDYCPRPLPDTSIDGLLQFAEQFGLPLASVNLAEINGGFTQVAQAMGMHHESLRRFAAALRLEVLQGLMDSLRFGAESWVACEVARRHKRGGVRARQTLNFAPV